jgi:starvation-inducible DNA-binding protein
MQHTTVAKEAMKQFAEENRADHPVVRSLQTQVANSLVLYANYKHYHWQTFGPHFRDLHLMWDQFAKEVLEISDDLAERIRMIGPDVEFAQLSEFQKGSSIQSAGRGQTMREMVEEADANLHIVIKEMRDGADAATTHKDCGTNDLLSRIVQVYEKQEWFLREILKKNDGLRER